MAIKPNVSLAILTRSYHSAGGDARGVDQHRTQAGAQPEPAPDRGRPPPTDPPVKTSSRCEGVLVAALRERPELAK